MKPIILFSVFLLLITSGCSTINETSNHQMQSGVYNVKKYQNRRYYIEVKEQEITLHPLSKENGSWISDTARSSVINLHTDNADDRKRMKFATHTFDLDVISILFKYRPGTGGFPNQLNTNFNAGEFVGYRTDTYILSFDRTPLNTYHRRINHFAFSIGGFLGLGATQMNPFVTNNYIQSEYDGVLVTQGVAGLIGFGEFTFGTALGFDHLMDKNRKAWIYQGKPWLGFTVGFNIN